MLMFIRYIKKGIGGRMKTKEKAKGISLANKIFKVMEKAGTRTTMSDIKQELINNRLLVIPTHEDCTSGKHFTMVKVKYTIIDVDNSEQTKSVVYGQSDGDTCLLDAAAKAEKLFFAMMFLTRIEKDGNK